MTHNINPKYEVKHSFNKYQKSFITESYYEHQNEQVFLDNSNTKYYYKYLKYRNKYLSLKKILGGSNQDSLMITIKIDDKEYQIFDKIIASGLDGTIHPCKIGTTDIVVKIMDLSNSDVLDSKEHIDDFIKINKIASEKEFGPKIYDSFVKDGKFYLFMDNLDDTLTSWITKKHEAGTKMEDILEEVKKIVFPIHPRTYSIIQNLGLSATLKSDNIIITEPLGYFDTQTLIHYAKFILTDSGGVTKEAYYHKTQAILLDKQTEWIETVNEGWNIQAGPSEKNILNAILSLKMPESQSSFLGSGDASKKISYILHDKLY